MPKTLTDEERLERKRSRNRKANMSLDQIKRHNERGLKKNLTPEQLEKKNSRNRKENLTSKELDKKREISRKYSNTLLGKKKTRERMSVKRSQNPMFRVSSNISRTISFMLTAGGSSKAGKSFRNYVAWDSAELKAHLEFQFEPWMNWDNYGKYNYTTWKDDDITTWTWQVDHIIPRSDLPYTSMEDENFKKCWSLDNLRPLNSKLNILDGTSRARHSNYKE
jgi:hypothetical protein